MALVALTSVKGAPGVTTAALAVAAVWPAERPVVVAELDPAGGDVAARFGLSPEPNLVTLAAAIRHGTTSHDRQLLLKHCQELPGGLPIVAGPSSPSQARASLEIVADTLPALGADAGVDVIADCGRLESSNMLASTGEAVTGRVWPMPASRIVQRADWLLVVTRSELAELMHLEAWLPALRSLNARLSLVLISGQYRPSEVARELGVDVLGELPMDHAAAAVVGGRPQRGDVARLPLFRAAASLVDTLANQLAMPAPPPVDDTIGSPEPKAAAALDEAARR